MDGNVIRVLSRLRAFGGNPKHAPLVEGCWEVAKALVEGGRVVVVEKERGKEKREEEEEEEEEGNGDGNRNTALFHPGDFNQSLMELGATICSPKTPKCPLCPVREVCRAYAEVNTTTATSSSSSSLVAGRSNNRGRASIVIDYAEDEEERALYSRVRGTCVTKYPYPKKKKKLKEENWNVTVVEWQPKTVRTIVGTAAVGATSFLTVEC